MKFRFGQMNYFSLHSGLKTNLETIFLAASNFSTDVFKLSKLAVTYRIPASFKPLDISPFHYGAFMSFGTDVSPLNPGKRSWRC